MHFLWFIHNTPSAPHHLLWLPFDFFWQSFCQVRLLSVNQRIQLSSNQWLKVTGKTCNKEGGQTDERERKWGGSDSNMKWLLCNRPLPVSSKPLLRVPSLARTYQLIRRTLSHDDNRFNCCVKKHPKLQSLPSAASTQGTVKQGCQCCTFSSHKHHKFAKKLFNTCTGWTKWSH